MVVWLLLKPLVTPLLFAGALLAAGLALDLPVLSVLADGALALGSAVLDSIISWIEQIITERLNPFS